MQSSHKCYRKMSYIYMFLFYVVRNKRKNWDCTCECSTKLQLLITNHKRRWTLPVNGITSAFQNFWELDRYIDWEKNDLLIFFTYYLKAWNCHWCCSLCKKHGALYEKWHCTIFYCSHVYKGNDMNIVS